MGNGWACLFLGLRVVVVPEHLPCARPRLGGQTDNAGSLLSTSL